MSHEGAENYCHIGGEFGLLCGSEHSSMYFNKDDESLISQIKKGVVKCTACGLPRCQECIRVWKAQEAASKVRARMTG